MNLSVSVWGFLTFVCYLIIAGFFLRMVAVKNSDNNIGKALAFIF